MQKLNRLSAQAGAASQQAAAFQSEAMGGVGQALAGSGSALGGGFKNGKFSFENITNALYGDDSDDSDD